MPPSFPLTLTHFLCQGFECSPCDIALGAGSGSGGGGSGGGGSGSGPEEIVEENNCPDANTLWECFGNNYKRYQTIISDCLGIENDKVGGERAGHAVVTDPPCG